MKDEQREGRGNEGDQTANERETLEGGDVTQRERSQPAITSLNFICSIVILQKPSYCILVEFELRGGRKDGNEDGMNGGNGTG